MNYILLYLANYLTNLLTIFSQKFFDFSLFYP
ncbi:MAG: hypothetical protein UU46_C0026G0016, partial [Candidatus Uhrbacteria bacterium GW2011_GWD1_41_16]